jgi:putative acetyltransferase
LDNKYLHCKCFNIKRVYQRKGLTLNIRSYHFGEEHEIWQLFNQTIHHVNSQHYTQKQLDAWAPSQFDKNLWCKKLTKLCSFVCINNDKILGYSDLHKNGHIDHFFCHYQYQGIGVGSALMAHIHTLAKQQGIIQLSAYVSITVKAFFEAQGFNPIKQQAVTIRGQVLTNFKMVKTLNV